MSLALNPSNEAVLRVLILGSCVSRDILNFAENGQIKLADYFARSSIASIASDPCHLEESAYKSISSDFQRRMVRRDLCKTFLDDVTHHEDFDIILIDLIDERFDLYEMSPGSIVTISSEFLMTGALTSSDRSSERCIRSGSERHRELWKAGISRLFTILAEHGVADRVTVNKVFWADRLEDGTPLPEQDAQQRIAANDLLAWMYKELEQYVAAPRWMTFAESAMLGSPNHRWGIAPFHYSDVYYTDAVVQLRKLDSTRRQDGAMVVENGKLLAWSGRKKYYARQTCFLTFKNKTLLHKQPYSAAAEMIFDTELLPGNYEVFVLTLAFDPAAQERALQRTESRFSFQVDADGIVRPFDASIMAN
jgi:hypothetical protein